MYPNNPQTKLDFSMENLGLPSFLRISGQASLLQPLQEVVTPLLHPLPRVDSEGSYRSLFPIMMIVPPKEDPKHPKNHTEKAMSCRPALRQPFLHKKMWRQRCGTSVFCVTRIRSKSWCFNRSFQGGDTETHLKTCLRGVMIVQEPGKSQSRNCGFF